MYTITPFHDGVTNMPALYNKIHDCKQVSRINGIDAGGCDIYIVVYWDTVENRALVYDNKKYVHIDTEGSLPITINNILKAFGLSYLDVNITNQFINNKPVTPDNKMLDIPISETFMSLIEVIPNIHCGDGIDSDDYDSD